MVTNLRSASWYVLGSSWVTVGLFVVSLIPSGSRQVGTLETIQGIPYPTRNQETAILEPLAHVDVYLTEPVLAKNLQLTFAYQPQAVEELSVGVREGAFWLSYPRQVFYRATAQNNPTEFRAATVTIPLTDTLQDKDRSVDVMFFADYTGDPRTLEQPEQQPTQWVIRQLQAEVTLTLPTWPQTKDYLKSIIRRERPL